jgi:phosphohistidine phosphatase
MSELLIVRHAIAMDREEALRGRISDAERPLTKKGKKRMAQIAAGIARECQTPVRICSSPLLRARQTAELLAAHCPGLKVDIEELLSPGTPLEQLVAHLHRTIDEGCHILVGHEPALSALISLLLFGKESPGIQMKKGGAALLDFPRDIDSGQGTLLWLQTPRQLSARM